MPKVFYTEHDIDELQARGVTSLEVTNEVMLTDLAVERAFELGLKLNRSSQPAPRAILSPSVNTYAAALRESPTDAALKQRVKAAVLARLDGQVENTVLEATIERVLRKI